MSPRIGQIHRKINSRPRCCQFSSIPPLGCSLWRPRKYTGAESGERLDNKPHELIGCQSQYTEHEVGHHFGPSSDSNHPTAEFVFEPSINPLNICPLFVTTVFRPFKMKQFKTPSFCSQFFFKFGIPAGVDIDNGYMPQRPAVLPDNRGIICRVHQIIQVGDPLTCHGCQR